MIQGHWEGTVKWAPMIISQAIAKHCEPENSALEQTTAMAWFQNPLFTSIFDENINYDIYNIYNILINIINCRSLSCLA